MARGFNGTSDTIDCGTGVNSPAAITTSAWVNFPTFTQLHNIGIGRLDGTNLYFFYVAGPGTGLLGQIAWAVQATGGTISSSGSGFLSSGVWNRLTMTYSSATGLNGFINTTSDLSLGANGTLATCTGHFGIGWDPFDNSDFWQGSIADAAQWNIVLSADQITKLAAGRRANNIGANANLDGYWPLQGTQSPEPDLSGNGHPGVLNGTVFAADPPLLDPLNPAQVFIVGGGYDSFVRNFRSIGT